MLNSFIYYHKITKCRKQLIYWYVIVCIGKINGEYWDYKYLLAQRKEYAETESFAEMSFSNDSGNSELRRALTGWRQESEENVITIPSKTTSYCPIEIHKTRKQVGS